MSTRKAISDAERCREAQSLIEDAEAAVATALGFIGVGNAMTADHFLGNAEAQIKLARKALTQ